MSDVQLLLARMRLAAEIDAKFKLVDQLRGRCMQKIEEIQHRFSEAKIVEIVDANAKLKELGDQLAEAEPTFTELTERFKQASSNISDLTDQRFDRTAPAMLQSLERLQSVWEAELMVLDDLMNQLEGRSGS
jgi:chromosome segregation ATPase